MLLFSIIVLIFNCSKDSFCRCIFIMLPCDKINAIQYMNERAKSNSKIVHKLSHYDQYEKQLNKLKFQLKMKRKIYNDSEFKNINERLNFCEAFFKKEKYRLMREEADKILSDSRKLTVNVYNQMKDKLAISKKTRIKPIQGKLKADSKNQNFKVNVKTQQSSLSESRVVLQYELTPMVQKKLSKQFRRKIETTNDQKQENERYVSQFERKIKQELSKIEFIRQNDYSKQEDESISEGEFQNMSYKNNNRRPTALPSIWQCSPIRHVQKSRQSQTTNFTALTNISSNYRYTQMKNNLVKNRANIKERQLGQISRIKDQDMDAVQKSRILQNMAKKYDRREKSKDDQALQLMCQATLARADALLIE